MTRHEITSNPQYIQILVELLNGNCKTGAIRQSLTAKGARNERGREFTDSVISQKLRRLIDKGLVREEAFRTYHVGWEGWAEYIRWNWTDRQPTRTDHPEPDLAAKLKRSEQQAINAGAKVIEAYVTKRLQEPGEHTIHSLMQEFVDLCLLDAWDRIDNPIEPQNLDYEGLNVDIISWFRYKRNFIFYAKASHEGWQVVKFMLADAKPRLSRQIIEQIVGEVEKASTLQEKFEARDAVLARLAKEDPEMLYKALMGL